MSKHVAGMITWSCQSVWLRNARSLACHWQTHLPDGLSTSSVYYLVDFTSWVYYLVEAVWCGEDRVGGQERLLHHQHHPPGLDRVKGQESYIVKRGGVAKRRCLFSLTNSVLLQNAVGRGDLPLAVYSVQSRKLKSRDLGRGIDSRNRVWNWLAMLHRMAGWYDNPMPTWFLVPIAGLKLQTLYKVKLWEWRPDKLMI